VQGEDDVDEAIAAFIDAGSQHRHRVRETDPPMCSNPAGRFPAWDGFRNAKPINP